MCNYDKIGVRHLYYILSCSIHHVDFTGFPLTYTVNSPTYVPSPFGAWLAISNTPSTDTFSDWFRYVEDMTFEFESTLVLKGVASEGAHR